MEDGRDKITYLTQQQEIVGYFGYLDSEGYVMAFGLVIINH